MEQSKHSPLVFVKPNDDIKKGIIIYCPKCRDKASAIGGDAFECRKCDCGFVFIGSPFDCGKTTKIHDVIVDKRKGIIYCPICRGECDKDESQEDPPRWHCKDEVCDCDFQFLPPEPD